MLRRFLHSAALSVVTIMTLSRNQTYNCIAYSQKVNGNSFNYKLFENSKYLSYFQFNFYRKLLQCTNYFKSTKRRPGSSQDIALTYNVKELNVLLNYASQLLNMEVAWRNVTWKLHGSLQDI